MPSCYVCIYTINKDNKTMLLIAKKNTNARWLDWNGATYRDPQESTDKKDVRIKFAKGYKIVNNSGQHVFPGGEKKTTDETQVACAFREFLEETGYNLNDCEDKVVKEEILKPEKESEFYGIYVKLEPDKFESIFKAIEAKLKFQSSWKTFKPDQNPDKTIDDELELVKACELDDAKAIFKKENLPVPKSTTWFSLMLDKIPK